MIKYYCNICNNEILNEVHTGSLDFTKEVIHLCSTCYPKFDGAKESIYSEYNTRYNTFKSDYLTDLRNIILNDVDPEPVWEDDNENVDPEPEWEDNNE